MKKKPKGKKRRAAGEEVGMGKTAEGNQIISLFSYLFIFYAILFIYLFSFLLRRGLIQIQKVAIMHLKVGCHPP